MDVDTRWFGVTLAWIRGTILGIAGALFGILAGSTARSAALRKRLWPAVQFGYWKIFFYSLFMPFFAFCALEGHQPRAVWYSLLIPGAAGTAIYGALCVQFACRPIADDGA